MSKTKEKLTYDQLKSQTNLLTTGFVKVQNNIIRQICIDINPLAGVIYIILLSHRNSHDQYSYPGIRTIELESGIGRTAVFTYIKKLEECGFIKVIHFKDNKTKRQISNEYFFPMESFYDEEAYQKELYNSTIQK